jgi:hypothetical protein
VIPKNVLLGFDIFDRQQKKKTFTDGQTFQNHRNSSRRFLGITKGQMGPQLGFTSYSATRQPLKDIEPFTSDR